jgi:hypothetical protein
MLDEFFFVVWGRNWEMLKWNKIFFLILRNFLILDFFFYSCSTSMMINHHFPLRTSLKEKEERRKK